MLILGVSSRDKLRFISQLKVLLNSGIPLIKGLQVISKTDSFLEPYIHDLILYLRSGMPLSSALRKAELLDNYLVRFVKVAELTGDVNTQLELIEYMLEQAMKVREQIRSVFIPFIFSLGVMGVVSLLFLKLNVPNYLRLMNDLGVTPPKILLLAHSLCQALNVKTALLLLTVVSLLIFLLYQLVKNLEDTEFMDVLMNLVYLIPVIGKLLLYKDLYIMTVSLRSAISQGIPMAIAFEEISGTLRGLPKDIVKTMAEDLKLYGQVDFDRYKHVWLLPRYFFSILASGVKTGKVESSFNSLAQLLKLEVEVRIHLLNSLMAPVLSLITGILLFFLTVITFMPLLKLIKEVI